MATYRTPGVYVEELPGFRTIGGVSTSVAAFVGRTVQGPKAQAVLVTSWNGFVAEFGGFGIGAMLPYAVYAFFAQGGSVAYVVRAMAEGAVAAAVEAGTLAVRAAVPGLWGNDLALQVTNSPGDGTPGAAETPVFALTVLARVPQDGAAPTLMQRLIAEYAAQNGIAAQTVGDAPCYLLETFDGLTAQDLVKPEDSVEAGIERRINGVSQFIRLSVPVAKEGVRPANMPAPEPLEGGTGDTRTAPMDLPGALQTLDTLDDISLLAAPDVAMIEDIGIQRDTAQALLIYCENRPGRDLFAILDTPFGLSVDEAVAYKTGAAVRQAPAGTALRSSYGAVHYPWIRMLDPGTSRIVTVPPSGAMAGTYVNTDNAVGVWQAPAGVTYGALNVATGVERALTDDDSGVLNPDGVNAIRTFVPYGILNWGARTLSTDPEYRYISVRRTLIYIEQSLKRGLHWVVFEPNGPGLWQSIARDVTAFLTGLWQQGGLVGNSAAEAFWVRVDVSNNPPEAQRQGVLHVNLGVALIYPAEFIVLSLEFRTSGVA